MQNGNFSKEEKFAIKWFEENGYTGRIIKQYISKTIFEITNQPSGCDDYGLDEIIAMINGEDEE